MKTKTITQGSAIALGICTGVILGLLIDDIALGIALGPLFGIIFHELRPAAHKDQGR